MPKLFLRFVFFFLSLLFSLLYWPLDTQELGAAQETSPKPWPESLRISGAVRQETAYRIAAPKNFSKIKQFGKLDIKYQFNDMLTLKIGGRAFLDTVYIFTDQFPDAVEQNMRKELALRDAYLNISLEKMNLRIGHQQIVWGEALGQFFADVVTPKDLREFFLADFSDVRLPIWAFDMQYFISDDTSVEIVLSPDRSVHKLAPQGADFAFLIPSPAGMTVTLGNDVRPQTNFINWNGGIRLVSFVEGLDLSLFYYTSPDHEPTLFKSLSINPISGVPNLTLTPRHQRVHHFGTTFSKAIEPVIVRGEFVFTARKLFNAQDITVNNGLVRGGRLRYVLGLDYPIAGRIDMNMEFQQEIILRPNGLISDRRIRSWLFFHFSTGFFNEKLRPELTFILGLDAGDSQLSPRLTYNVTDAFAFSWGADIFSGPNDEFYGEFDSSDRIFMNTEFAF